MTARLLQVLGLAFVLLLAGGSIVGFLVLKDRVRIVIQDDAAATGPDATALLRDEVQVLTRDLAALAPTVGQGLEQLANGIEERAAKRHGELMVLQTELAALRRRTEEVAQQLVGLRAEMASRPAATITAAPAALAPTPEPAPTPTTVPVVEPAAAVPAPPSPPPTTGFLSFTLPSAQFHFDQLQDYVLVPSLCRVGFDAKSTLHDFTGVTSTVAGHLRADFDDPAGAWTGEVTAETATLVTGVDGRDTNMREYLDAEHHAKLRFAIERFVPAAGGIDKSQETARGDIVGSMTIRGVTHPFTMPVEIAVDAQKRVVVTGQAPLKLSDYGVQVPSQFGVVHMQDEVVVWIALRARLQLGAAK